MISVKCPVCAGSMVRNGKTAAGTQRWLCPSCRSTKTHRYDTEAKKLEAFLDWLLGRARQADMPGGGRSFRRDAERFWRLWPVPEPTGEVHRVVFADGIHLARDLVVLIASDGQHVLSWHAAPAETTQAWCALFARIAPPEVVVGDGGTGFLSAVRRMWPSTRVQRCLFHVAAQVRRYTTRHPQLEAARELLALSYRLTHLDDASLAAEWLVELNAWCTRWESFLAQKTRNERGRLVWTHERLVKARNSLLKLVRQKTLFVYLDPTLSAHRALPRTNNAIEGGINAQIRSMLRDHRGLSKMRRMKAVFWWCYMHTEEPMPYKEMLARMPTDDSIAELYRKHVWSKQEKPDIEQWGTGLVWEELHNGD